MGEGLGISVVISTYNQCRLLPEALESVIAQETGGVRYEVIVVDNNSSDHTRQVVESFIACGHSNLNYVFEGNQGVSHGRNAGIARARAPIIAFMDDDVRPMRDWVATIKRIFDENPDIDCVGGKVLPQWKDEPPSWLTRDHWSPLALLDYGNEPFCANTNKQLCLISANLSFRRHVFDELGPFLPEFQRVRDSIGSMEDHQYLERFWRAGKRALYVPNLVVSAPVPAARITKAYHRRWHTGHGKFYAIMRSEGMEQSFVGRLFDVPAHLYRQAAKDAVAWLKHSMMGNRDRAFTYEVRLRFFVGFFCKRRKDFLASGKRGTPHEIATFVRSLVSRKEGRRLPEEIG